MGNIYQTNQSIQSFKTNKEKLSYIYKKSVNSAAEKPVIEELKRLCIVNLEDILTFSKNTKVISNKDKKKLEEFHQIAKQTAKNISTDILDQIFNILSKSGPEQKEQSPFNKEPVIKYTPKSKPRSTIKTKESTTKNIEVDKVTLTIMDSYLANLKNMLHIESNMIDRIEMGDTTKVAKEITSYEEISPIIQEINSLLKEHSSFYRSAIANATYTGCITSLRSLQDMFQTKLEQESFAQREEILAPVTKNKATRKKYYIAKRPKEEDTMKFSPPVKKNKNVDRLFSLIDVADRQFADKSYLPALIKYQKIFKEFSGHDRMRYVEEQIKILEEKLAFLYTPSEDKPSVQTTTKKISLGEIDQGTGKIRNDFA